MFQPAVLSLMPAWFEYNPEYYRSIGQKDSSRLPNLWTFWVRDWGLRLLSISYLGPVTQLNFVADLKSSSSGA